MKVAAAVWGVILGLGTHACAYVDVYGLLDSLSPGPFISHVPGQPFQIEFHVCNLGSDDAAPFTVRFYLSRDAIVNPLEFCAGERRVPGLAAYESFAGRWEGEFPTDIAAGVYDFVIVADADNEVPEESEGNNTQIYREQRGWGTYVYGNVPNVVGTTLEAAQAAISAAGLTAQVEYADPSGPCWCVTGQEPEPETLVLSDCVVHLIVSSCPAGSSGPRLVAHWRLDETSGTVARDSAGDRHGTVYGGAQWASGQVAGALRFDGYDDYVALPIGPLIGSLTDTTVAAWVNWSGQGGASQCIFSFGTGPQANMLLMPRAATGELRFAITTGGAANEDRTSAPHALPTGWHHVAVTIDANEHTHSLYLDGSLVAANGSARYTPASLGNTSRNWLGRSQGAAASYYAGRIDNLHIYSGMLSEAEIDSLMGGSALSPVAYWKLDEAAGIIAYDSAGSHHGILYGGPVWQPTAGVVNGALQFDGVDDYVGTGFRQDLVTWTACAWVMSPAVPAMDKPSGPVQRGQNYQINWNHTDAALRGAAAVKVWGTWHAAKFGPVLLANTWYHLAATYDGETLRAYRDGVLVTANEAPSGDPDSEPAGLELGRGAAHASSYFNGMADEVRIYGRALSDQEIVQVMSEGAAR
jgi:hypothetical protein